MIFLNKIGFSFVTKNFLSFRVLPQFVLIICIVGASMSQDEQECSPLGDCKCRFSNGSTIDLSSIGHQNEARWKDMMPTNKENYTYFFNPCFHFSIGQPSDCKDVSVCQVSMDKTEYQDCGKDVQFKINKTKNSLYMHFISASGDRKTNVALVCSAEATSPTLTVMGENLTTVYEMMLTSRCACPDLCRENHLSAGSVMVILLMISVGLYLILGIIHSSLTRGAHGWELIPHYEFWFDFPLLVKDGCVFVMSGCKADTAYERI